MNIGVIFGNDVKLKVDEIRQKVQIAHNKTWCLFCNCNHCAPLPQILYITVLVIRDAESSVCFHLLFSLLLLLATYSIEVLSTPHSNVERRGDPFLRFG
uniref:Uncharacterized protein n=1 Tax=Trichobilharzia regenti TaxID=157069 RepID=A0AA85JA73_TRIRE|nr:unnamed protein product [Trichobilharzia regenti]